MYFLFNFSGHIPSQFKTLQLPSTRGLKSKLMSPPMPCVAQTLVVSLTSSHTILSVSVTLGSFLFLKHAKLFLTPGPLSLLFPLWGTCFLVFLMADFLIYQVTAASKRPCLTTLSKDAIWPLSSSPLPHTPWYFPSQGLLHCVTTLLFLCLSIVCLLLLHLSQMTLCNISDLACFAHHCILST